MNRKKFLLENVLFILFLFAGFHLSAQVLVDADTTQAVKEKKLEKIHSPRKATLYSAILPGLGQAYNKKYWKIPIVYIGFGAIGYFIDWNNDNYQFNKKAYRDLTDDDDNTTSYLEIEAVKWYNLENTNDFNKFKDGLLKRQEYYHRNRDLLIISMIGFYGLNIIDASVDAHLFNFDISDDLTFNWKPSMKHFNRQNVYSINCSFNF